MAQRLSGVTSPVKNAAKLVLPGPAGVVVISGGEVQGLLVAVKGGSEVFQEHPHCLSRGLGIIESLHGDRAERFEVLSPAVPVGVWAQVEAVSEPTLGLVQVP